MSTETLLPAETQRTTRGHAFYPPKDVLAKIPALYVTEATPLPDKLLHAHWFTGGFDWYVAELDPASGRAMGLVCHAGEAEWGYFMLPELETIRPRSEFTLAPAPGSKPMFAQTATGMLQWLVERDCYWTPTTQAQL